MLVVFDRCVNVIVRDVTLTHSPMWTNHVLGSTNVLYDNVTVFGDYRWPNGDGIDPDSTRDVLIHDCYIRTGDDGIAMKSGWDEYGYDFLGHGLPTQNVTIRNCKIRKSSSNVGAYSVTHFLLTPLLLLFLEALGWLGSLLRITRIPY